MDDKRKLNDIARNRTMKFVVSGLLSALLIPMFSVPVAMAGGTLRLPAFNEYNRAVGQGAEYCPQVSYQGMPSYRLAVGSSPPSVDGWESHSMLTTGLFRVQTPMKRNIVFHLRSNASKAGFKASYRNILWVSLRYYDRHGVLLKSAAGVKVPVAEDWRGVMIPLWVSSPQVAYAELWLVKYQDASYGDPVLSSSQVAFYISAVSLL